MGRVLICEQDAAGGFQAWGDENDKPLEFGSGADAHAHVALCESPASGSVVAEVAGCVCCDGAGGWPLDPRSVTDWLDCPECVVGPDGRDRLGLSVLAVHGPQNCQPNNNNEGN